VKEDKVGPYVQASLNGGGGSLDRNPPGENGNPRPTDMLLRTELTDMRGCAGLAEFSNHP
jgi:hypothetical protein